MPLPPHDARSPTDSAAPQPVGFCDRCGFKVYLADLRWQYQWSGPTLTNTFLLVHDTCWDVPNEQGRTIVIGPDPVPLKDPRPGFQISQENATGIPPIPPYVTDDET